MSTRLAIFDCDGTLVDGVANICQAMDECFAAAALPVPPRADTRRIIGLSLPEAMRQLHPAGDAAAHDALASRYKSIFQRLRVEGLPPDPLFEGMREAIGALIDAGWRLGVATGKSDRGLALALDQHRLDDRFVTLQTADRHPSKPHPAMAAAAMAEAGATAATTAMIGDTSYDMMMAKAAGIYAVGVTWGYHDRAELVDAGADAIADHPSDIPRLLLERFA